MLYPTAFASPQLELLELDETQWIKVQQRAASHRRRRVRLLVEQLPLLPVESAGFLVLYGLLEGVGKNFFPYVSTVMVLPQVPCCRSCGIIQHPLPEKSQLHPAIPAALDQLQAVDVAFDWPV